MQKINLRELYPDVYKTDVFVDVAEEVVAAIRGQEQDDAAYERRKFRHKAHYSLNREDGIENDALNRPLTPAEVLEQKLLREEVYAALMQLTAIQARRIYARFYLGMTVAEIARIEGADRRRVWESIRRGLKKLARWLDTAQSPDRRIAAKREPVEVFIPPPAYLFSKCSSGSTPAVCTISFSSSVNARVEFNSTFLAAGGHER